MAAPEHLSDAARRAWGDTAASRTIAPADAPAFEAYVVQLARMRAAQRQVDSDGALLADKTDRLTIPHPALAIEQAASAEMRMWTLRRPDLFGVAVAAVSGTGGGVLDELARARAARIAAAAYPVDSTGSD